MAEPQRAKVKYLPYQGTNGPEKKKIQCIQQSVKSTIYTTKARQGRHKSPWRNNELSKQRKLTRKLFKSANHTGSESYKLPEINKETRKSKTCERRKFGNEIEKLPQEYRMQKVFAKNNYLELGAMKPYGGTHTSNKIEIFKITFSFDKGNQTRLRYLPWAKARKRKMVSYTKIKWPGNSFKTFKCPERVLFFQYNLKTVLMKPLNN